MNWSRLGRYATAALLLILTVLAAAVAFGLAGDCGLDVPDCGETGRRLVSIAMGLGVAALLYLIYRFIRGARENR